MTSPKKDLVVKSNRIVEASYRLTLNEQRIILYSICRAREEQKGLFPNLPVTITADTFAKQFPSINSEDKTNVYRQLKEAMDTLYERSVTFYDIDPATGMDRVNKTRWVSQASYIDGAGHVQVIFTPAIIEHITRLEKEFTSYQLEKISSLTSSHAVRLYEILTQYLAIGSRELNLKWLRDALQIPDDMYKLNADFIARVIDSSVQQINDLTDLKVSYTTQKTSRAITSCIFKIKLKSAKKPKPARIDDAYLSKHARPGETRDQAFRRLLEERGQQRLPETD
jgi:plasmid replication initiation protein